MSGKNMVELEANKNLHGTDVFEGTFASLHIDELLLEFDPKHSGAPVAMLSGPGGVTKEVHVAPQRGREGRFSTHVGGTESWTGIRVYMVRETKGRLVRVKMIGKPPA